MPRERGSDRACGAEEGGVGATPAGEGGIRWPEREREREREGGREGGERERDQRGGRVQIRLVLFCFDPFIFLNFIYKSYQLLFSQILVSQRQLKL
jgi:hypothetical protein